MAGFDDFSLDMLGGGEEEKKEAPRKEEPVTNASPDFSGLRFEDIAGTQEEISTPAPVEVTKEPQAAPEYNFFQGQGMERYQPTIADLDTDEEGVMDYLWRRGGDIFSAGLTGSIGAFVAEGGRLEQDLAAIGEWVDPDSEDDSLFTKALKMGQNLNPLWMAISLANEERGKAHEAQGAGVRTEANKDLAEIAEEADTTGKQIAFDVVSSAAATSPALATAPLGVLPLTLNALGATVYFDTTQEAIEAGESRTKARIAGFIDGSIEKYMEKIPLTTLFGMGQSKNVMKDALKFLVQEEGTELATEALQAVNEKLMYNPDLTMKEVMDTMARTAMSTPFSAGLQASAMRGVQKIGDTVGAKVDSAIEGYFERRKTPTFTPFSEEVLQRAEALNIKREEMEGLQGELKAIMEEVAIEAANTPDPDMVEGNRDFYPEDQRFNNPDPALPVAQLRSYLDEKGIYPTRKGKRIDLQDIKPGEVVIAQQPNLLENIRAQMVRFKERYAKIPNDPNYADIMKSLQDNYIRAQKTTQKTQAMLSKAQDVLTELVKKYSPEMKIILHASDSFSPGSMGAAMPSREGAVVINLDLNELAASITSNIVTDRRLGPSEVSNPTFELAETVVHEFGHALVGREFQKQSPEMQQAIRNDWERFLGALRSSQGVEMAGDFQAGMGRAFERGGLATVNLGEKMRDMSPTGIKIKTYAASFPEFVAHRMARLGSADPAVQSFYKSARDQVEKYWKGLPPSRRFDKSFQLFLNKLAKENQVKRAEEEYAGRVRRYRAALGAMREAASRGADGAFNGGVGRVVPPQSGGPSGGHEGRTQRIKKSIDQFNWFINLTAGLTHISGMNRHVPGVTNYELAATEMNQDKSKWSARAAEVLRDWAGSEFVKGRTQRENLSKYLFEADRLSEENGRKLTQAEMESLQIQFSVTPEMQQIAERVWSSFDTALNEVEQVLIDDLQKRVLAGNAAESVNLMRQVRKDFANMRNRNYMPHSRFGSYTLTGYANSAVKIGGEEFKQGDTVFFGSYATEGEVLAAQKEMKRKEGRVNWGVGRVSDTARELLDLPPALAELLESKLSLTPEQLKELTELRAVLAPGQSFRKRFVQRDGIDGYSQDSLRVYADYMQKFAGHVARIKHVPRLEEAIALMEESARGIRQQGGNSIKREEMIKWFKDHLEYTLNPGNELASLRAFGFLWYLGFNPKSAIVNATQVPMVTYPYLAQEYNDVSATAAISRAMYQVTKAQFTEKGMNQEYVDLIDVLVERGIVDESLATELAALAEGGFLARAPGKLSQKLGLDKPENTYRVQKFFEYGALLFQAMEKMNRRITAVAAYDLARKSGDSVEVATDKAHEAIVQTQYEYARFNRPRMMRGAVGSNVFMFWQYMTNTFWFLRNNKQAAARYMAIMFLLGGIEGIPFMGNALDLADFFFRKAKEITGWSDPKKGARDMLWEYASQWDDDPVVGDMLSSHTIMNGYGSRIMGMYDLSGSLQMGRMLPGTEYLSTSLNTQTEVLGGMRDIAGAVVNIPLAVMQAAFSDDPDVWKRWERAMPSVVAGLSASTRYAVRGEETDSSGAAIAEFNWPNDVKSWAELMGRGTGFQLSRVTEKRDRAFASYDAIQYYKKRSAGITAMFDYAYRTEDDERMSEAWERAIKFNQQVPFPEMQIPVQTLVQRIKNSEKKRQMREAGLADEMKYIRLKQDVESRRGGGGED